MDFRSKKAVLLDLDGTIIDSAPGILRSAQYALQNLGREMDSAAMRAFIGPPLKDCFTQVCGLTDQEALEAVQLYRERYGSVGKFECSLYPGVEGLLKALHQSGRRVLLATSKPEQFAAEILEHLGVAQYFDRIGGAALDHSRETKEEVLAYVLEDQGLSPEDAVMVGDRRFDIEGAKAFSMASIGVLYGFGERPELEMAGADAIVSSTEDLAALLGISEDDAPLTWVYLVRHAQPDNSVHEDALRPLTPKGWADRALVTRCLQDQGIDLVCSSPYKRAMDTVEDFAQRSGLSVLEIPAFRERRMGSEWIPDEDFRRHQRLQWEDFSHTFSGGESLGEVEARVRPALEQILAGSPGRRIAIGGHGTAFSVLLHSLDAGFGYEESLKICRRSPWIVQLIFQGKRLLSRTELL